MIEITPEEKKKYEEREFERPVAWLVGRDLLGGLKGMALYTAYGSKLDPRDWMTGEVFDFRTDFEGEEFWFDYIADAGDGTKAMYAIAYMVLSDLWRDGAEGIAFDNPGSGDELPRGQFLFVGGDTAYHNADYLTLANRIQKPFTYAFEDLKKHVNEIPQRPIFGIPGNHDYYDQVDGFRRQFRKPVLPEPPQPPQSPGGSHAQLGIAGFDRMQQASYLALKLPFRWWLWGLDTETGPLDDRQHHFFADITDTNEADDVIPPRKLIVATSSPSTVFGKVANDDDFKATKALKSLFGPSQPFFPNKRPDGTYDFSTTGDACIESGHCRLDISGDVHHYARYWGPATEKAAREKSKSAAPSAQSYASVVSGSGGAFHHPSNTYDDELQEQVLWPSESTSRAAVGRETFNFWSIWKGGYVWLFGFIIAFVLYFGTSVTQSSRQFVSNLPPLASLGLIKKEPITPTTTAPSPAASVGEVPCRSVTRRGFWRLLGLERQWTPPAHCRPDAPYYFFAVSWESWPKDLFIGQILIFLSLITAGATFFLGTWLFGKKDRSPRDNWVDPKPFWKIFWIAVPTALAVFLAVVTVEQYRDYVTPYVSSLMILFTLVVAAAAIVLTVRYNDYLFKKGHFDYIKKSDRIWPWALPILSVLLLAASLWSFGRNNLPALLVTDIIFTLIFFGVFCLLVVLPTPRTGISAELLYSARPRALRWIGSLLIGAFHAVLQVFVPFVLVRKGTWLTWIIAAALLPIMMWGASRLFARNKRFWLVILWVAYGAIMLVLLPWLTSSAPPIWFVRGGSIFADAFWLGPWGLVPSVFAGLIGAVISCLWFGWYLGVCSILNGHNNEIGGAARIEQFKEFIRFRLSADGLTGYVIGIEDVSMIGETGGPGVVYDGRDLKPKLIDVFHLKMKP